MLRYLISSLFLIGSLFGQQINAITQIRNLPTYDVRSAGAKCDGSTDDHSAFTTALATYSQIILPPSGNCYLNTSTTIPAGSTIIFNTGYFTIASTKTLTFNGEIESPRFNSIFAGLGSVVFGHPVELSLQSFGAICDDSTDDTSRIQYAMNSLGNSLGGILWVRGTCLVSSAALTYPNDGGSPPFQKAFQFKGFNPSVNSYWGAIPQGPSELDLQYNTAGGKLQLYGMGVFGIKDINLVDNGSDSDPFIYSTNPVLQMDNVSFQGTNSGYSAAQDAIILGGSTANTDNTSTAPFQGYGSNFTNIFFSKIRRGFYLNTFVNQVKFDRITYSNNCGSNITTSITGVSNASAAVLTSASHGLTVGQNYYLNFSGMPTGFTSINGIHLVTVIDGNTFSVAINSTGFGSYTSGGKYYSGAAFEMTGGASTSVGNTISMLIESLYYPYSIILSNAQINEIVHTGHYDNATGSSNATIAFIRLNSSAAYNYIRMGFSNDQAPPVIDASGTNTVENFHQSTLSTYPWPVQWTNPVNMFPNTGYTSPYTCNTSGDCWYLLGSTSGSNYRLYLYHNTGCVFASGSLTCSGSNNLLDYWDAGTTAEIQMHGSATSEIIGDADLKTYSADGSIHWLGSPTYRWYLLNGVLTPAGSAVYTYSNLPLSPNGSIAYCSDCLNVVDDSATAGHACAGSGHGTIARRENSYWRCN